jgi:hypothetical protein
MVAAATVSAQLGEMVCLRRRRSFSWLMLACRRIEASVPAASSSCIWDDDHAALRIAQLVVGSLGADLLEADPARCADHLLTGDDDHADMATSTVVVNISDPHAHGHHEE